MKTGSQCDSNHIWIKGYPSYLAPSAKKARRIPKARDTPPRKRAKLTAGPDDGENAALESSEQGNKQKATPSMKTTNTYNAQWASDNRLMTARLRSQVAYYRSKCSKVQQQLEAQTKVISSYPDDKHDSSLKNIAADTEKGEKKKLSSCFTKLTDTRRNSSLTPKK